MERKTFKEIYKELKDEDISDKIQINNRFKFLSWSSAWNILCNKYEDVKCEVINYDWEDYPTPYFYDRSLGYMVHTRLTIEGHTREMRLPVMDGANKSMKSEPYTYKVKEYKDRKPTGKMIDKEVDQCSMFDINKAHMRCFVKNAALFGLGIDLYVNEDIGTFVFDEEAVIAAMNLFTELEDLIAYWKANEEEFKNRGQVIAHFAKRKKEINESKS